MKEITLNGAKFQVAANTMEELKNEALGDKNGEMYKFLAKFNASEPDIFILDGFATNGCVGVAGLGGLGSNIALSLARTGVAKLVLADFDVVEPSNLNRQQYFVRHIGMKKTDALKELIADVNPFVEVVTHDVTLTAANVAEIFAPSAKFYAKPLTTSLARR